MDASPPRRRIPRIVIPLLVIVVLGAVWSVLWYRAAGVAETTITAWIEREAQAGRVYACASRSIGGFPFRIELRCTEPRAELRGAEPAFVFQARELHALAQVYQPNHVIAEIVGPLTIAESGRPAAYTMDWRLAQASLRGLPQRPERVSIVFDAPKLERPGTSAPETLATAAHLELHARLDPAASQPDNPAFDLAASGKAATVPPLRPLADPPLDFEASAVLRGITDFNAKPVPVRLKEWQAAGGRVDVTSLRVAQGNAVAVAAGDLRLSASGRPDGTLNVTVAGLDRLVQALTGGATQGSLQTGLLAGIGLLGERVQLEGKNAVRVPLRLNDGAVALGPLPLGRIPPLY